MACCSSAALFGEAPSPAPKDSGSSSPSRALTRAQWHAAATPGSPVPLLDAAPSTPGSAAPATPVSTSKARAAAASTPAVPADGPGRAAALVAAGLNGVWKLDKAASEPMAPLMTALGAPWFVVKALGEIIPTWTLTLTTSGAISFQHVTETNGRKTTNTYELGATTQITGMEPGKAYPGTMTLADDGSLRTSVKRAGDATYLCVIERPYQSGRLLVTLSLVHADGRILASAKRVFNRVVAAV